MLNRRTPMARAATLSDAELGLQRAVDVTWLLLVLTTAVLTYSLLPALAHAAPGNSIQNVLCSVVRLFQGDLGKALASIAICILGIGALLGKISWTLALTTVCGITVMLGAGRIVNLLFGRSACGGGGGPAINFGPLTQPFCYIASIMSGRSGSIAKLIATLGIQILALGAFFGKVSWNTAMVAAIGVALLIGAGGLINMGTRGATSCAFFSASAFNNPAFGHYFGM